MKLSSLDSTTKASEGIWIDISDPSTGNPTGLRVKILGSDSKVYKAAEKEVRALIMKGKDFDDPDAEVALRTTIDWEGAEDDEGKPVAFSQKELRDAFAKYPTIRDQIIIRQKTRALFMKAVSEN